MQGSNADIIKVAMIRIHDRLREEGRGARLVLQVHDELLLEVPDAEVTRRARARPRAEMVGAYELDPPLAVDVGVGENWAEAKSVTPVRVGPNRLPTSGGYTSRSFWQPAISCSRNPASGSKDPTAN